MSTHLVRAADFDYRLPPHLIAQTPVEPRDASRLLVVHRDGGAIEHRRFADLPDYLRDGDLLVLNETRVIPARLIGRKGPGPGGARVEVLLVRPLAEPDAWEALVRPSRRLAVGAVVLLDNVAPGTARLLVGERLPGGMRKVTLPAGLRLEDVGAVPLPPYIRAPLADPERYQTVYARAPGSVAAPTAGLHFTPDLLDRLARKGVRTARLTLDVGPGTFRPVKVDDVSHHDLGRETYTFPREAADAVREAARRGARVVCVGTTSVRTLETVARDQDVDAAESESLERLHETSGATDLFILPGFRFRLTGALVTNFHLPRSTLLMLVSAFAGKPLTDRAYAEAVSQEYRFYSFGDAMLVL